MHVLDRALYSSLVSVCSRKSDAHGIQQPHKALACRASSPVWLAIVR